MSASTDKKQRAEAIQAGTYKKNIAKQEASKKKSAENRKYAIGGSILALLIILALLLNSGFMYTATTAAKVGGVSFSPAQVSVYYGSAYQEFVSSYGSYASMFGLDTSYGLSGLGSQQSFTGGTWKEYFTDAALGNMQQVVALEQYAKANGITLSSEELADIDSQIENMKTLADTYGYKSFNAFLAYNYGKGVNEKIFRTELERMALAGAAADAYSETLTYTPEQLSEKYESLNGDYEVINYAVYTVNADVDYDGEVTEEEAAAASGEANAIVEAYNEAEGTPVEKLNAALEQANISLTVSNSYSYAYNLNNVYAEWLTAQTEEGTAGVVENENGAVVVVFIAREANDFHTATVRHILVKAEADADGVYTDEALAAAKAGAEDILARYNAGDKTEQSFIDLVAESDDAGSVENGGLYEVTDRHSFVEGFTEFALADHQSGDTGIVYGEAAGSYAGYHVMYYVEQGQLASDFIAENLLKNEDFSAWTSELYSACPAQLAFFSRYVGLVG